MCYILTYDFNYFNIISSSDYTAEYLNEGDSCIQEKTILDNELTMLLKEWANLYEHTYETAGHMIPRASIYEQIEKYTVNFLNFRKLQKQPHDDAYNDALLLEEQLLDELRTEIISNLRNNIQLLSYLTTETQHNIKNVIYCQ